MQMRKTLIIFILIAILAIIVLNYFENSVRCKLGGVEYEVALKKSQSQLDETIKYLDEIKDFALVKTDFDDTSDTWVFEYRYKNCIIYINVDKCGYTDISGISGNCKIK